MKGKKFLAMFLSAALSVSLLVGCGGNGESSATPSSSSAEQSSAQDSSSAGGGESSEVAQGGENQGEPIVIRWGHNWTREMDTTFRDEVTGEPSFGEEEMNARLYAEQQVLEKYNVKIEFVQYPTDLTQDILQSVLAGDPIADIVRITNGTQGQVLAQNVLQPLDDYAYLFEDEDDAWIYWGKVYGHNYFLNNVMRFGSNDLLCYNIGMLDDVEALKVDGKTKYPADYFVEGTWTWSVFEDYLQKIDDYWKQQWDGYHAYQTDYRAATLDAIYSNGGEVYGDSGLGIASDEAKEAVAFIKRLISKGLMYGEKQNTEDPTDDAEIDGLAEEGALAYKEISQINSNYYHLLDVRHGPMVLIGPGTMVLASVSAPGNRFEMGLVDDLIARGAKVVCYSQEAVRKDGATCISLGEDVGPVAGGLGLIALCQLISYHKSGVMGCNPDQPDGLDAWIRID